MNTWAVIASGPSLHAEDIDFCRQQGWNLATCNMGFRMVPDARVFHAMDYHWWEAYGDEAIATLRPDCQIWTGNGSTKIKRPALNRLQFYPGAGWSTTHGRAYCGDPPGTGEQLLQIVGWQQPDLIVLLGFDCQHTGGKRHCHEDYPEGFKNVPDIERHIDNFRVMGILTTVPIINCSRDTALQCFPRMKLEDVSRETKRYKTA